MRLLDEAHIEFMRKCKEALDEMAWDGAGQRGGSDQQALQDPVELRLDRGSVGIP